ncbi:unnamed protein product, partial [Allacma fusca]
AYNKYVQSFEQSGIPGYHVRKFLEQNEITGQQYAKVQVRTEEYYAGETTDDISVRKIINLALVLYMYGLISASICCIIEAVITKSDLLRNSNYKTKLDIRIISTPKGGSVGFSHFLEEI